jgi:hypothetical protein
MHHDVLYAFWRLLGQVGVQSDVGLGPFLRTHLGRATGAGQHPDAGQANLREIRCPEYRAGFAPYITLDLTEHFPQNY